MLLTIRPALGEAPEDGLADLTIEEEGEVPGLAAACRSTRRLIRRAFQTARPENVGRPALEAVNRRETGERSNERPFYAEQKVQTIRKYARVWTKILRYIWRTAERQRRPDYELTEEQKRSLAGLQDSVDGEQRAAKKDKASTTDNASLAFWIAMFDHELKDREFESGVISAAAVLGLEVEREGWRSALSYTPVLSAIITVMRALVVYKAYNHRQQSIQSDVRRGLSEEEAKRKAPAVVHGVDAVVKRFMTIREFGGRVTPMDRLLRQRTYGMRIRYTTKAEGRVSWNGKRILIDNKQFDMDDIRTVVHGLLETARERLYRDLMFVDNEGQQAPAIDIEKLADNPAEMSEGWSFLEDARNEFPIEGKH